MEHRLELLDAVKNGEVCCVINGGAIGVCFEIGVVGVVGVVGVAGV